MAISPLCAADLMPAPESIAFSPGSATCFFNPIVGPTPETSSSPGCAININLGVHASVTASVAGEVLLNGRPIHIDPVETILASLSPEPVRVALETALPLGHGFGVSAACCLTTAMAVAQRYELGLSRTELGLLAHQAEVRHRTGLGDVAAQLCGGVVRRRCRTSPLDTESLPVDDRTLYLFSWGALRTASVLQDASKLKRIREAAGPALDWLDHGGPLTLDGLMDRAVQFSEDAGLLDAGPVRDAIRAARAAGEHAMMALLGQSVLGTWPGPASTRWTECKIDYQGARLVT
jgi:pantoate kinase